MSESTDLVNLLSAAGWFDESMSEDEREEFTFEHEDWDIIGRGAYRTAFLNNVTGLVYKVDNEELEFGNNDEWETYSSILNDEVQVPKGTRIPYMIQEVVLRGDAETPVNIMEFIPNGIAGDEDEHDLIRELARSIGVVDLLGNYLNTRRDTDGTLVPIDFQSFGI